MYKFLNSVRVQLFDNVQCACTIFDQVKYPGVLLNVSLKDDDDIQ